MFKPTFGQANTTTGFGGFTGTANANPFGQTSVFGKTTTTGFAQQPFGTSGTTGLFGSSLTSTGGLFGSSATAPTFGQAQTTQPSFGFGTTAQPTTNLFGSQPNTGTGLFSSGAGSAFGANKPAFGSTFGTGTTTGLFGSQQPTQAATPLFGQSTPATGTGLFGGTTGSFAGTNHQSGTVIKFNPITGNDTMVKNGVSQTINTRHFCITCMKEYETKSLEELRLEDYVNNRKGPQQSNLFGAPAQQSSLFGTTTGATNLFGSQPTENKSLFGGTSTSLGGFGTSSGNVFGSAPTATNSLFGSKPTGFGTTTTSSPGFGFGATSTNSLFGNTQNKPFGTTAQTGLFGQPTTQTTTGFNATPGFTGFGTQPNQSIGLFSSKPTTSFNLGATTSSGFTFGSNTTTNTGLFGQKPATTGFGTTPATGFGTGFGTSFGTSTATSNSLFKPTTTNFGFGTTPSSTGLGTGTLGTSGSLFGSNTQKPGGIFGNTTGTGLFGSSFGTGTNTFGTGGMSLGGNSLGGGSLFGNTSLMPTQPSSSSTHPAILALSSVPFADSALFKNLLPASGKTDSLLKPSNAVTQKAMLACKDLKVSPKNSTKIKLKSLATPLTKKSLFEGLEETEVVSPSFTTMSSVKKLSLKPKLFNTSVSESWVENVSNKENQLEKTPRRVSFTIPSDSNNKDGESFYIRRNPLFKPQRHSTLVDLEKTSVSCNRDSDIPETEGNSPTGNKSAETPSTSAQLDETAKDSSKQSNSSLDETRGFLSDTSRYDEDWQPHPTRITMRRIDYYTIPSLDDLTNLVAEDGSCIVDNFCIGRHGYGNLYFEDTMDVSGLNVDEIVHFRHKEVNVYPDDEKKPSVGSGLNRKCQVTLEQVWPVDKTTREPITDPERLLKMKYEEKLRRSTAKMGASFMEYRPLSGSWVFKVDHFSKYGLSDSDEEDEGAAAAAIIGKPVQPPLVPTVQKQAALPPKASHKLPVPGEKSPSATILSPILPTKQQCFSLTDPHATFTVGLHKDRLQEKTPFPGPDLGIDVDEEMDEDDEGEGDDMLEGMESGVSEHFSPSIHLARRSGIDSHRVQLMKASLFEHENDEFNEMAKYGGVQYMDYSGLDDVALHEDQLDPFKLPRGIHHSLRSTFKHQVIPRPLASPFETKGLEIRSGDVPMMPHFIHHPPALRPPRPKTVNLAHAGSVIPYAKSSVAKVTPRCISDMAIFMGRSFRNGWGPFTSMTLLTTMWRSSNPGDLATNLEGRTANDTTPCVTQRLFIYNKDTLQRFKESVEGHLVIQLEHSNKGEENGCPIIAPMPGVDALHAHCSLASSEDSDVENEFLVYCRQVWELCVALWGNLSTLSSGEDPSSHKTVMMRKEAVTDWLRKCAHSTVRQEVERHTVNKKDPNRHVSAVLSLLSGREIEDACSRLQKQGDHFAALLLSSGPSSKPILQDQLSEWQNVNADAYIDKEKLQLLCLSSGLPLFSSTKGLINICENLDWKRAFALHFWYLSSPVATIADTINKYETAFDGAEPYAYRPHPPYSEEVMTSSGRHIYDLCYHLLKLFCFKSHPLEQLLNPATYSSDPLDYRLSWLLEQVLSSLGYVHVSETSSAVTCVSFASQLEAYGLWHWAIFVYLHITDSFRRKQAVIETMGRHVTLTEERELTIEEEFIVEELGIPSEWVYRAKATKARSQFRYHDATHYLIQAREWNEAHQIIIDHIAADAVINENYDYLKSLLESLAPNSSSISEWYHLGQLLWDYLEVNQVVQQALAEQDTYELERRQTQISSLCTRILRWPCKSAKDRLCQAEISKRTAHIFHNVMQLHGRMTLTDVADVVSKLPLPEDYLMEELRHINEAFAQT